MNEQKLEWSVTTTTLVVGARFEDSAIEGKRSVLTLQVPGDKRIELRLKKENFQYLARKIKMANRLREVFNEADGQEFHRWILRKNIKVRARKFVDTKRIEVEFIDIVD